MTDDSSVWPPENVDLRNGTSIIELLIQEHTKKHPATVDKTRFFQNCQHERQSDVRYVAEMKKLYEQNGIANMSGEEILCYHVLRGFKTSTIRDNVLKNVKAKDSQITMEIIDTVLEFSFNL